MICFLLLRDLKMSDEKNEILNGEKPPSYREMLAILDLHLEPRKDIGTISATLE